MRKLTLLFALISLFFIDTQAQEVAGIDKSPLDMTVFRPDGRNTAPVARIIYSRPAKKGRTIFGDLVPYGKVWRTGANESTELSLYKDITIGGKNVKAGTYTLYTVPGKDSWTIIINSALNTWGSYNYDKSKDVVRVNVDPTSSSSSQENFGIAFGGGSGKGKILLAWDTTKVTVEFEY